MPDSEGDFKKALRAAYQLLAIRDYSKADLKDKLRRKKFSVSVISRVISELEEKNYINDEEYARALVRHCQKVKRLGLARICMELKKKALSKDVINKAIEEYSPELEKLNLTYLIERKTQAGYPRKKIINFLSNRGYPDWEIIKLLGDPDDRIYEEQTD